MNRAIGRRTKGLMMPPADDQRGGAEPEASERPSPDYEAWLAQSSWSLVEAIYLALGSSPPCLGSIGDTATMMCCGDKSPEHSLVHTACADVFDDVLALAQPIAPGAEDFWTTVARMRVRPHDFCTWAWPRAPQLPPALRAVAAGDGPADERIGAPPLVARTRAVDREDILSSVIAVMAVHPEWGTPTQPWSAEELDAALARERHDLWPDLAGPPLESPTRIELIEGAMSRLRSE